MKLWSLGKLSVVITCEYGVYGFSLFFKEYSFHIQVDRPLTRNERRELMKQNSVQS